MNATFGRCFSFSLLPPCLSSSSLLYTNSTGDNNFPICAPIRHPKWLAPLAPKYSWRKNTKSQADEKKQKKTIKTKRHSSICIKSHKYYSKFNPFFFCVHSFKLMWKWRESSRLRAVCVWLRAMTLRVFAIGNFVVFWYDYPRHSWCAAKWFCEFVSNWKNKKWKCHSFSCNIANKKIVFRCQRSSTVLGICPDMNCCPSMVRRSHSISVSFDTDRGRRCLPFNWFDEKMHNSFRGEGARDFFGSIRDLIKAGNWVSIRPVPRRCNKLTISHKFIQHHVHFECSVFHYKILTFGFVRFFLLRFSNFHSIKHKKRVVLRWLFNDRHKNIRIIFKSNTKRLDSVYHFSMNEWEKYICNSQVGFSLIFCLDI